MCNVLKRRTKAVLGETPGRCFVKVFFVVFRVKVPASVSETSEEKVGSVLVVEMVRNVGVLDQVKEPLWRRC